MNKGLLAMIALIFIGGIGVVIWKGASGGEDLSTPTVNTAMHGAGSDAPATPADQIVVPEFSEAALKGQAAFNANCAACHGLNAAGTNQGPPLVHKLYEPGHHGENAFLQAAKKGVTAHHWRFGNMKPVPGVTKSEVRSVVTYVRELQRANGIN